MGGVGRETMTYVCFLYKFFGLAMKKTVDDILRNWRKGCQVFLSKESARLCFKYGELFAQCYDKIFADMGDTSLKVAAISQEIFLPLLNRHIEMKQKQQCYRLRNASEPVGTTNERLASRAKPKCLFSVLAKIRKFFEIWISP
jgi:hypothetical protein